MSEQQSRDSSASAWLSGFAWLAAASTFVLIFVGGLVTSHGVGLAVPDWPNTYGYNMFFFPIEKWMGGIFYEHTHRLLGAWVGFLTLVLAIWFFGRKARRFLRWTAAVCLVAGAAGYFFLSFQREDKLVFLLVALMAFVASLFWPMSEAASKRMRWLGVVAVVAVVIQGVLGGLRVTMLSDGLGIIHGALAQSFFILIVGIALVNGRWWKRLAAGSLKPDTTLRAVYWVVAAVVFGQLLLGASMRHQHAGLAIPDFPMAHGMVWPSTDAAAVQRYNQQRMGVGAYNPITAFHIYLHMAHRIVAVSIFVLAIVCLRLTVRRLGWQNPLSKLAVAFMVLIVAQILLGAATIWTGKSADIATAHVAVGAITLAVSALLCLVSRRLMSWPAPAGEVSPGFLSGSAAVSPLK